jgi:hypothetical protein
VITSKFRWREALECLHKRTAVSSLSSIQTVTLKDDLESSKISGEAFFRRRAVFEKLKDGFANGIPPAGLQLLDQEPSNLIRYGTRTKPRQSDQFEEVGFSDQVLRHSRK